MLWEQRFVGSTPIAATRKRLFEEAKLTMTTTDARMSSHARVRSILALVALLGIATAMRAPGFDRPPQLSLGSVYQDELKVLSNTMRVMKDEPLLSHWPYGIYRILEPEFRLLRRIETVRYGGSWLRPMSYGDFGGLLMSKLDRTFLLIRANAMVLGLGIVLLTWIAGRRLAGEWGGLGAAWVVAITPLMVKYSRMMYYDIALVFFFVLYLLVFAKAVRERSIRDVYLAVVVSAVAFTMKQNAAVLAISDAFLVLHVVGHWRLRQLVRSYHTYLLVGVSLFFLWVGYPTLFRLDGLRAFVDTIGSSYYGAGGADVALTDHLWFEWIRHHWIEQAPPIVMLFLAAGNAIAVRKCEDKTLAASILAVGGLYYLIAGYSTHPIERTLMPLIPILALGFAGWVAWVQTWSTTTVRRIGTIVGMLVFVSFPLLQNTARANLLITMNDTRIQVRDWLLANAPDESMVVREAYTPHLPQALPPRLAKHAAPEEGKRFRTISVNSLASRNPESYRAEGADFVLQFRRNVRDLKRELATGVEVSPRDLSARQMGKSPRYGVPIREALGRYERLDVLYPEPLRFDANLPPRHMMKASFAHPRILGPADVLPFLFSGWYDPGVRELWRNRNEYVLGDDSKIYRVEG